KRTMKAKTMEVVTTIKTEMAVKGTATVTMGTVRIREVIVPATKEDKAMAKEDKAMAKEDKAMAKEDKAMAKETTRGVKQAQVLPRCRHLAPHLHRQSLHLLRLWLLRILHLPRVPIPRKQ
ncbi:hypothetical protein H0H87_011613, partial [Tephrocybe sp. NHM501043]